MLNERNLIRRLFSKIKVALPTSEFQIYVRGKKSFSFFLYIFKIAINDMAIHFLKSKSNKLFAVERKKTLITENIEVAFDYTAGVSLNLPATIWRSLARTSHLKESQGHRVVFRTPFAAITRARHEISANVLWHYFPEYIRLCRSGGRVKVGPVRRPGDTTQTHLLVSISRRTPATAPAMASATATGETRALAFSNSSKKMKMRFRERDDGHVRTRVPS